MSNSTKFVRPQADLLVARLLEPRRFIQVLSGPRQVGKQRSLSRLPRCLSCRHDMQVRMSQPCGERHGLSSSGRRPEP